MKLINDMVKRAILVVSKISRHMISIKILYAR
jgi:hypothetical protein